jgi:hypothetical protein
MWLSSIAVAVGLVFTLIVLGLSRRRALRGGELAGAKARATAMSLNVLWAFWIGAMWVSVAAFSGTRRG